MDLLERLGIAAGSLLAFGTLACGAWTVLRRIVFIGEAVKELTPNGGSSVKDTVTRTDRTVREMAPQVEENTRDLAELKRRFDEHLADGPGGV